MINVIMDDPFESRLDPGLIERAAQAVLENKDSPFGSDLSVVIQDDSALRALNLAYLGIDSPTDVLSFPSGEPEPDPDTGRRNLGDVIISYPRAENQARAAGHDVDAEIQLLVVHGVLHLLGHDHSQPEEKERMWTAQNAILERLGVRLSRLPD